MQALNKPIDIADLRFDTNDLRLMIARRADELEGRQRRHFDAARQAEINHLRAAYRVLNGFLAAESPDRTAMLVAADIIPSGHVDQAR